MTTINQKAIDTLKSLGSNQIFSSVEADDFDLLYKTLYEFGKNTLDISGILSANAHLWGGVYPLIKFGTATQQTLFLPSILTAERITGHAITEPQAGSDVDCMLTHAEKVDQGFILNGHKRYITNAPIADWLIIYAKTEKGVSAFIIEKEDEGVSFITKNNLSAFKNSPIGDVMMEKCFIPDARLLGPLGSGKSIMQSTLEHERIFLFAGIAGVMSHTLEKLIQYTRTRKMSKGTLANVQIIQHTIANLRIKIDTIARWLEYCVHLKQNNKRISLASSQVKVVASEAFLSFCQEAIQVLGAVGLEEDQGFSELLLSATACRILSGSNEIQKNIIAALIGG